MSWQHEHGYLSTSSLSLSSSDEEMATFPSTAHFPTCCHRQTEWMDGWVASARNRQSEQLGLKWKINKNFSFSFLFAWAIIVRTAHLRSPSICVCVCTAVFAHAEPPNSKQVFTCGRTVGRAREKCGTDSPSNNKKRPGEEVSSCRMKEVNFVTTGKWHHKLVKYILQK